MDFSTGPAQTQSLTVSPGQQGLLALQSVAFHGIIEFRKGCRYTTGVWNNGRLRWDRNKRMKWWHLIWAMDKWIWKRVKNGNISTSTYDISHTCIIKSYSFMLYFEVSLWLCLMKCASALFGTDFQHKPPMAKSYKISIINCKSPSPLQEQRKAANSQKFSCTHISQNIKITDRWSK